MRRNNLQLLNQSVQKGHVLARIKCCCLALPAGRSLSGQVAGNPRRSWTIVAVTFFADIFVTRVCLCAIW